MTGRENTKTQERQAMKKFSGLRNTALLGLMVASVGLTACTVSKDLHIINSCSQPVTIGESHTDSDYYWYPLSEGMREEIGVGGYSSILLTVLPAGAAEEADPTEIKFKDLDWVERETAPEFAEVDLAEMGLCP